jgi:hypothetical protein
LIPQAFTSTHIGKVDTAGLHLDLNLSWLGIIEGCFIITKNPVVPRFLNNDSLTRMTHG